MTLHHGENLDVMAEMEPESVDAVVTDPPYGLEFMGKAWDKLWNRKRSDFAVRPNGGFSPFTKQRPTYQAGAAAQEFHAAWAEAAFRVAKPSAYLLAFGGTRTVHRMTVAIEDAGWIIRDMLVWAYASGFPKSKASLKPAWEPIVMARKPGPLRELAIDACRIGTEPTTTLRSGHSGDHGILGSDDRTFTRENPARWPANVILTDPIFDGGWDGVVGGTQSGILTACQTCGAPLAGTSSTAGGPTAGSTALWPVLLPRSEPITSARSAASGPTRAGIAIAPSDAPTWADGREASTANAPIPVERRRARNADLPEPSFDTTTTTRGLWTCGHSAPDATTGYTPASTGGYSRFFLLSKADRADREPVLGGLPEVDGGAYAGGDGLPGRTLVEGVWTQTSLDRRKARANHHPTVKSTDLMRHLVRLVTPTGGIVLDPFAGSGSTLLAAEMEGFGWVGIEKEAEYVAIAEARLNGVQRGLGLPA